MGLTKLHKHTYSSDGMTTAYDPPSVLRYKGWSVVDVERWLEVTDDWLTTTIKGDYTCFGRQWYFELKEDAEWFMLRWK